MQKRKIMAIGIALGMVFTLSIQVFAAPTIEKIQAYVNNEMSFQFNGKAVAMPEEYDVIVYKDRSYVPARFVADNLGATVKWDNNTKVISFESKESATMPIVTPPGVVTPTEPAIDKPKYNYLPLSQYRENTQYFLEASMYTTANDGNRLWFKLKNKGDYPLQLDQMATTFVIDDKEYDMSKADIILTDRRWYADISKDNTTEAYILLPKTDSTPENMHIELKLKVSKGYNTAPTIETVTFDIALPSGK